MTAPLTAPRTVACRLATRPDELAAHYAIRRAVFVAEQGLFTDSDADARDAHPATLHVLGLVDGCPAGTVRLFPLDPAKPAGDWQGDRLAVLPEFRSAGLGRPLVRFAVTTAGARGGAAMIAHIQPANRTFFRWLGWRDDGEPEIYLGHRHLPMRIELDAPQS
jgi:putative N-acetyltransferase (TIGR04045 family)